MLPFGRSSRVNASRWARSSSACATTEPLRVSSRPGKDRSREAGGPADSRWRRRQDPCSVGERGAPPPLPSNDNQPGRGSLRCARATPSDSRCPPHLRLFATRQGCRSACIPGRGWLPPALLTRAADTKIDDADAFEGIDTDGDNEGYIEYHPGNVDDDEGFAVAAE